MAPEDGDSSPRLGGLFLAVASGSPPLFLCATLNKKPGLLTLFHSLSVRLLPLLLEPSCYCFISTNFILLSNTHIYIHNACLLQRHCFSCDCLPLRLRRQRLFRPSAYQCYRLDSWRTQHLQLDKSRYGPYQLHHRPRQPGQPCSLFPTRVHFFLSHEGIFTKYYVTHHQNVFPEYTQVLNALVDGTQNPMSITVNPPSGGFKAGSGYRVNVVTDSQHLSSILVQSDMFTIKEGGASSSSSVSASSTGPATILSVPPSTQSYVI